MLRSTVTAIGIAALLGGCGARNAPGGYSDPNHTHQETAPPLTRDASVPPPDAVPGPGSPPDFCRGAPVLQINDLPSTVLLAKGGPTQMSCCEGASLYLFAERDDGSFVDVDVIVGAAPGGPMLSPLTIDLARPPAGWAIRFRANFRGAAREPCPAPCVLTNVAQPEQAGQFRGYLRLNNDEAGQRRISVCAEARPAAGATTHLWSLRLHAPDVVVDGR